jgi:hypothetical protein
MRLFSRKEKDTAAQETYLHTDLAAAIQGMVCQLVSLRRGLLIGRKPSARVDDLYSKRRDGGKNLLQALVIHAKCAQRLSQVGGNSVKMPLFDCQMRMGLRHLCSGVPDGSAQCMGEKRELVPLESFHVYIGKKGSELGVGKNAPIKEIYSGLYRGGPSNAVINRAFRHDAFLVFWIQDGVIGIRDRARRGGASAKATSQTNGATWRSAMVCVVETGSHESMRSHGKSAAARPYLSGQ